MTKTLPTCLTRTAADDRAEARSFGKVSDAHLRPCELDPCRVCDAALAAIQRRDAWAIAQALDARPANNAFAQPADAVCRALLDALRFPHDDDKRVTPDQFTRGLDAARALVALALGVA